MKKECDLNTGIRIMLTVYTFLYIFTSICRQFLLFSCFDLRYLAFVIGCFLIVLKLIYIFRQGRIRIEKRNLLLALYILFIIICNFMWFFNQIQINEEGFRKLIILHIFNICGFLIFIMYNEYITVNLIWKTILFSTFVLTLSMFLVYFGVPIESIWGTGRKGINIIQENSNLTRNLFRQNVRAAGYAEDPNYATLFLALGILSLYQMRGLQHSFRFCLSLLFIGTILIANSNTVFISLVVSVGIMVIFTRCRKSECYIFLLVYFIIAVLVFILPIMEIGNSLITLASRYDMWNNAFRLFLNNPLLGNGLSSFRSIHSWYVHCHSTYWSILAESGILAFLIMLSYLYTTSIKVKDNVIRWLLIFFSIYCMMFDMTYMQITVVIICLVPEVYINEYQNRKNPIYY